MVYAQNSCLKPDAPTHRSSIGIRYPRSQGRAVLSRPVECHRTFERHTRKISSAYRSKVFAEP